MATLRSILVVFITATLLTACGVKRPLIAPKDIPAYEAKRAKKMEEYRKDAETPDNAPSTDDTDK